MMNFPNFLVNVNHVHNKKSTILERIRYSNEFKFIFHFQMYEVFRSRKLIHFMEKNI